MGRGVPLELEYEVVIGLEVVLDGTTLELVGLDEDVDVADARHEHAELALNGNP